MKNLLSSILKIIYGVIKKMSLTYLLLALNVIACFVIKDCISLLSMLSITIIAGLYQGIIGLAGLLEILFLFVLCQAYFNYNTALKWLRLTLLALIILFVVGLALHIMPGFSNPLVINKLQLSPLSCPFSMYLNFDKTSAALVLYLASNLYIAEKPLDKESLIQAGLTLLACISFILIPAFISSYIQFDPKLPNILWIWALNNLLFVCMAEEVIFRGFLQNGLKKLLLKGKFYRPYLHISIASIVFGLAHFKGGLVYVILASICGGFYGYAYEKTNRILCAMLVHFGLNLTHLLFFTYPAAIALCK